MPEGHWVRESHCDSLLIIFCGRTRLLYTGYELLELIEGVELTGCNSVPQYGAIQLM